MVRGEDPPAKAFLYDKIADQMEEGIRDKVAFLDSVAKQPHASKVRVPPSLQHDFWICPLPHWTKSCSSSMTRKK
jgi:hypothetical protein